jgi:hypothetical protein
MITGGLFRYEDGVKAGEEYAPPKKAAAEIHFSVPDGQDHEAIMDRAKTYAVSHVLTMLGRIAVGVKSAVVPVSPPGEKPAATESAPGAEPAKEPAKRGRPKKLPDVTEPFPEATTEGASSGAGTEGKVVAAEVPTAQRLIEIVKEVAATYKRAPEITALIKQYCPGDAPALTRIPEDKRLDFVAALDAAKKTWTKPAE